MRCKFFASFAIALLSLAAPTILAPTSSVAYAEPNVDYPDTFALPRGFRPEGIAIDAAGYAYFGSMANGAIYRADLKTGQGSLLNRGTGSAAIGLKVDSRNRLFVAGGGSGSARVIDTRSGNVIANYPLATGSSFVNDVVLAQDGAWFTDSTVPTLYKVPLGARGELAEVDDVVRLPLKGDIVFSSGTTNANGIATSPDERSLIIVQWNTGKLFQVNPTTGVTRTITLAGGESVPRGDGILRDGNILYVAQNRLNQIAKIELDSAGTQGRLITRVSDPRFDVPTTLAAFRDRLYAPNARFNTTPTPTTTYNAIAIPKP
ncbi:SMP-30/gluconolactonase/LRE family protein [Pendulispora albinea]|uniref:SMP-30/gluconolactonase/LRE family protein n=1 Tax=Pendulispora albinea TaxID=2741071 RepID=A0ABZ2LVK5_9BACT